MKSDELLTKLERYKELLTASEAKEKKAEDDLRDSRDTFAKAEQIASIGYWSFDLKTKEVRWSDGHFQIFGYQVGESNNYHKLFRDRVHPSDINLIEALVKKSINNNQPYSIDYRIVMSDGSVRHIHEEADKPATDSDGNRIRLFGIVQDITARKQVEDLHRETRENLARAERMAKMGYFEWDLKNREANLSEEATRIFGLPAGVNKLPFSTFVSRIHPEDREYRLAIFEKSIKEDTPYPVEYRIVLPDGSIRHIYIVPEKSIQDETGKSVKIFGVLQDITERKTAEKALQLSEEKYRTIVETASEGICIIKDEMNIIFTNRKFAEMLGYTQAEMMGENVYTFTDPDYHEILGKNLKSRRLGVKEQFVYKLRCKDGRKIWITASGSPVHNEKGEYIGSLAMVTDITDRKLADEQIKASLKEKEALLKEIHHRVKNNLQIISSLLSLQNNLINDEKYRELLRDSQNRIKSMALIHELLYKSKDLSNINISEYLHSLISYISRSYQHYSSHASLQVDVEDIYLDIERAINIGIIVTELVSNSIKYAFPENRTGEIRVDLHRDGRAIILTISDNGIGLPEDLDIHTTPTLGLQLVEILTEQLDGNLEIDRIGKTSFTICFTDKTMAPEGTTSIE